MLSTDQLGRKIQLSAPPRRIISLVPSQTELLYDLGLREEVVGITKFCVHPTSWYRQKKRVGGTKKYNFDAIAKLQPDLIIGNKEENDKTQIEQLMTAYPVWMSDIYTLADALDMIKVIGELVQRRVESIELASQIQKGFQELSRVTTYKVVYLIWNQPIMGVGSTTFIDDILRLCGFENLLSSSSRYPTLTVSELRSLAPEVPFLSSEPFPFQQKHIHYFQELLPQTNICLVDGEAFSWYGSRLLKTLPYLAQLTQNM